MLDVWRHLNAVSRNFTNTYNRMKMYTCRYTYRHIMVYTHSHSSCWHVSSIFFFAEKVWMYVSKQTFIHFLSMLMAITNLNPISFMPLPIKRIYTNSFNHSSTETAKPQTSFKRTIYQYQASILSLNAWQGANCHASLLFHGSVPNLMNSWPTT